MTKITQKDLKEYRTMENQIADLQFVFGELRADLMTRLDKGAKVERGERTAILKRESRRSISWRLVVIRLKSEGYVRKVLAATKPTFFFKLTVR